MQVYSWIGRGVMPREGGLLNQESRTIQLVRIFEDELAAIENVTAKRNKARAAAKNTVK